MPHIALKSILFFVVLALGTWQSAEAQTAAGGFAEFSQHVKPGDTIFVTDCESRETRGTLVRLSPTSLHIAVDGQEQQMLSADIGLDHAASGPRSRRNGRGGSRLLKPCSR